MSLRTWDGEATAGEGDGAAEMPVEEMKSDYAGEHVETVVHREEE